MAAGVFRIIFHYFSPLQNPVTSVVVIMRSGRDI